MAYELKGGEEWINGILHGWTGNKCGRCAGDGFAYDAEYDNDRPCASCGGTGEEHGAMPVQPKTLS